MYNKKLINIGVLGTSDFALRSIIPAILRLPQHFALLGVASRKHSKSKEVQTFKLIEGYESLLENPNLTAIYIPLPIALHYKWIKKALYRGLHVLVEKSLCCSYNEVEELTELAREKNLALVENFQFKFHSQFFYIKEYLAAKKLGEIRIVRSTFCIPPFKNNTNIRYSKELGGGALYDVGAYPVKLTQLILGKDIEVSSAQLSFKSNFDVDILGGATLTQRKTGLFSQIAFGFDNFYQCNLEIVGTEGKLVTNRIFTAGLNVIPEIQLENELEGSRKVILEPDDHFQKMLLNFYSVCYGDVQKEIEYRQNLNQAKLLEEVKIKAARTLCFD